MVAINEKTFQLAIKKIKPTVEFSTFLLGVKLPNELSGDEQLKKEIKKKIGIALEAKWKKQVDFKDPDVVFIIDFSGSKLKFWEQINSVYIYGRYLKFTRTQPQSKWPCSRCEGKGCDYCKGKGKLYSSFEDLAARYLLKQLKAGGTKLHACGREDIDVRMLGTGRPFVLEFLAPKRRNLILMEIEKQINKSRFFKVVGLRFVRKDAVQLVTRARLDKRYFAKIRASRKLTKEDAEVIIGLVGEIQQKTPTRVFHRRADKTRKRKILEIVVRKIRGNYAEIEVLAEAGSYIKEFIHGDNGRTKPSISEALGCKTECTQLDVIGVKCNDLESNLFKLH